MIDFFITVNLVIAAFSIINMGYSWVQPDWNPKTFARCWGRGTSAFQAAVPLS